MAKRKFPYKVEVFETLAVNDGDYYWVIHNEIITWLKEYIGKHGIDWWCNGPSTYFLMREEDAVAFKLRWL